MRSLPCVFLGYAHNQKGYRCLHLPTNKLYISRHVQFNESTFPFKSLLSTSTEPSAPPETCPNNVCSVPFFTSQDFGPNHSTEPTHVTTTIPSGLTSTSAPSVSLPPSDSSLARPITPTSTQLTTTDPPRPVIPAAPNTLQPINNNNSSATETITNTTIETTTSKTTNPTHPMVTRNRDNTRKSKHFPDFIAYLSTTDKEPTTFTQANTHLEWRNAMMTEIDALAANSTWVLVPPPTDHPIVGCKWVYKIKRKADGSIERYKARLVVKGFHQQEGIDYFDTFSPVVRPTTI